MNQNTSATSAGEKALKKLRAWPGNHRAVVGLSGGVDSSLSAALLKEAGWKVDGLTLWLMNGKGACCSDGLIDAAGICEQLKIPHHLVDSRKIFENEIIKGLVEGYKNGITPLPCSKCNRSVKFGPMLDWAQKELKVGKIATGHYARVRIANDSDLDEVLTEENLGRNQLLRGLDPNKDQSYFLYDLSQEILGKVVFPLGELTKEDTRIEANRYNLRTANKEESQDLCLVELHGSMKGFLDNYLPSKKGNITLQTGEVIGEHEGIQHFTIGQRKGLGVGWKEPLHVIKINAERNEIIVAPRSQAGKSKCTVGDINWISIAPPKKPIIVEVQLRYRSKPVPAELVPIDEKRNKTTDLISQSCQLLFQEEQFSITPGQAAVFYQGDIVLGGGLIYKDNE
ncbi:tRNA 2-thiouridine(34) synthase MnmA [Prochlorococcus sp. MIT 1341]|uniref:tRNA 2-thiouridine(34) synthase MnmA n=1 Tax=Prochlorococcus sp. MIT 1341 TaxID=3096221 RepID=UPI002A753EB4|nr:tRNA 2-thiouridine(34) synthase MnmA [Prochlorococcus sp. MIT 1341]